MSLVDLDATFLALADPPRRAVVSRLGEGPATPNALAQPFDMSLQAVSKHLKVLERAGIVTRTPSAQQRPAHLNVAALVNASRWLAGFQGSSTKATNVSMTC